MTDQPSLIPDHPTSVAERDALCAELGHPGATYNPWVGTTWCVCGEFTYDGNRAIGHISCCGGPLDIIYRSRP